MPTWITDLYGNVYAIVAALGGYVVICGGIAAFTSKFFADRSIERHKAELNRELERLKAILAREADTFRLNLKKQELIFGKELEAAAAFMKIRREISPSYSHPDMDWSEACEEVASRLGSHETKLGKYRVEHGAILPTHIRAQIKECEDIASIAKFELYGPDDHVSREGLKQAEKFLEELEKIENEIITVVRTWDNSTQQSRPISDCPTTRAIPGRRGPCAKSRHALSDSKHHIEAFSRA